MTKSKRDISRLLPDRHPQPDFFVCDIFDAAPKSDIASMEYPLFTLSTKPDFTTRSYKGKENWLKVSPSPAGLATVHDRDILTGSFLAAAFLIILPEAFRFIGLPESTAANLRQIFYGLMLVLVMMIDKKQLTRSLRKLNKV